MKEVTHDKQVDAVYVYLDSKTKRKPGVAKHTVIVYNKNGVMVNFDYDKNTKLIGVEIL